MVDFAFGTMVWYFIGYGMYTGDDPFVAGTGAQFGTVQASSMSNVLQSFGFAITCTTIMSGAGMDWS